MVSPFSSPVSSEVDLHLPQTPADGILQLHDRIRACRACQERGYVEQARPIVSGRGTEKLVIIGQAPGRITRDRGLPFSGPGGAVLARWLEEAGFPPTYFREGAYLTSLTHCYPGPSTSGRGDRPPSREELALCRPFLDATLQILRPRAVLLVGKMAIEAFWGKATLDEVVGQSKQEGDTLYLPLPHPSGVSRWLNDPQNKRKVSQALQILSAWRLQAGL